MGRVSPFNVKHVTPEAVSNVSSTCVSLSGALIFNPFLLALGVHPQVRPFPHSLLCHYF